MNTNQESRTSISASTVSRDGGAGAAEHPAPSRTGAEPREGKHPGGRRSGTGASHAGESAAAPHAGQAGNKALAAKWARIQKRLTARLGTEVFTCWFGSVVMEEFDGSTVKLSVATPWLSQWIRNHYCEDLLDCCRAEFKGVDEVVVTPRSPVAASSATAEAEAGHEPARAARGAMHAPSDPAAGGQRPPGVAAMAGGTGGGKDKGSPLDPRYTFDSFVVGKSNRLAHAMAKQVAETQPERSPKFNPLFIHGAVGLGKTHLLQAIAWDVKRRNPSVRVLYLTSEWFRYCFVEALKSKQGLTFTDQLRGVDILLVDDLQFLSGAQTVQEFEHTLNALLDGGRQVVIAADQSPNELRNIGGRLQSRLSGGLTVEVEALDRDLRLEILERRVADNRMKEPTFSIDRSVLEFLADRLAENARELEGAVNRLYAVSLVERKPITIAQAEHIIRDLMRGLEPKRIKIEDILRTVSKHFGVSRADILSQRRHRSIVWPRQIGMYLAKKLTGRSLPEIGRRFGGRDHTTVLHAIRKIDRELEGNSRLQNELQDLERALRS